MVTACSQTGQQNIDQYDLSAGTSQAIDLGTACSWPSAVVYASVTGQSNLAEFTIGGSGNQDFYDLNNANAYTIPMSINAPTGCTTITCSISDISSFCQPNNDIQTLPTGALSCVNTDGTAGLGPTAGTMQFKAACPQAYINNFDDATSTLTCPTGSDYEVVFCP
ncbi:hypothetical protein MPTK1_6g06422 [Marchantia polymorpha subsp. ruderalis]